MLKYRLGAASYAGGLAMARYVSEKTLSVAQEQEKARYYGAECAPRTRAEELGAAVHSGEMGFSDALNELIRAELGSLPAGADFDIDEIEERLSQRIVDGVTRADFAEETRDQTPGVVRPDIAPAMAARLGIDTARPLSLGGVANLMAGLDAAGGEIEGKRRRSPTVAVGAVFGASATAMPTAEGLRHVLAGRRVDGEAPRTAEGRPFLDHVIRGAGLRYRAAVGLSSEREPTDLEMANIVAGKTASGGHIDMDAYRRAMTGTRPPIGFADLTFSASKSLSCAWSQAKTDAERIALLEVHSRAVEKTMRLFVAGELGWARKGDGGRDGVERAELAWISYQHFTARPTLYVARTDAAGVEYSDPRQVASLRADPQLHTHVILLNHALVPETGRLASIDFDRLAGLVHQSGEVYRAFAAREAKALGIKIHIGEHGDAQLSHVPMDLQRVFSKRGREAHEAAREFAASKGVDWDRATAEQQIEMLRVAASETRRDKDKDAVADHDAWQREAASAGFDLKSVLRREPIAPALEPEQRQAVARNVLQPMVEKALEHNSVMDGDDIRALAARSMIASGIGDRVADEISAVTRLLRQTGVTYEGERADLVWDYRTVRGKEHAVVSTDGHLRTEHDVMVLTTALASDRSMALSPEAINRAADAYLKRHPDIDPDGAWKQQMEWAHKLGEGGRLSVGIGAAGVGKSTVFEVLADAWKAEGRSLYGTVLGHSQANDFAGIAEAQKTALDPFLRRAAKGTYALDRNSVVLVDEIGLLGNKQMRDLLKLGKQSGATIVMAGDPTQCRSPEAGDPIDLIGRALPDAIPEMVKSIRQKSAHEMAVTQAFRTDPAEGLRMKVADGSARLIAGGPDATIARAVALRRERMETGSTVALMAPTNATAAAVSMAIRADRQRHGEIGEDRITIDAIDRHGQHKMKLAVGDDVRPYRRIWEGRRVIARNGEAMRITALDESGLDVQNLKTGVAGKVGWAQLRQSADEPVRLSYAGCSTVDSAQGRTVAEAILVLADGTDGVRANKVYTALSRHTTASYLLVGDAAVRRQLEDRSVIGQPLDLTQADVWRAVGESISRPQVRENALDLIRNTITVGRQQQRRPTIEAPAAMQNYGVKRAMNVVQNIQRQVMDIARDAPRHVTNAVQRANNIWRATHQPERREQGPDLGPSRGPSLSR